MVRKDARAVSCDRSSVPFVIHSGHFGSLTCQSRVFVKGPHVLPPVARRWIAFRYDTPVVRNREDSANNGFTRRAGVVMLFDPLFASVFQTCLASTQAALAGDNARLGSGLELPERKGALDQKLACHLEPTLVIDMQRTGWAVCKQPFMVDHKSRIGARCRCNVTRYYNRLLDEYPATRHRKLNHKTPIAQRLPTTDAHATDHVQRSMHRAWYLRRQRALWRMTGSTTSHPRLPTLGATALCVAWLVQATNAVTVPCMRFALA